jgi:hypothetical protein
MKFKNEKMNGKDGGFVSVLKGSNDAFKVWTMIALKS